MTTPVVPLAGFEPARCFHRGILSPFRLPIPSQRHFNHLFLRTSHQQSDSLQHMHNQHNRLSRHRREGKEGSF